MRSKWGRERRAREIPHGLLPSVTYSLQRDPISSIKSNMPPRGYRVMVVRRRSRLYFHSRALRPGSGRSSHLSILFSSLLWAKKENHLLPSFLPLSPSLRKEQGRRRVRRRRVACHYSVYRITLQGNGGFGKSCWTFCMLIRQSVCPRRQSCHECHGIRQALRSFVCAIRAKTSRDQRARTRGDAGRDSREKEREEWEGKSVNTKFVSSAAV